MKTFLATSLFFLSFVSLHGQSYFWIGDSGDWSDLSHWATTSGGNVLHTTLPTAANDVFFDEHSFTTTGRKITVDQDSFVCNNLTLSGIEFKPTFQASDYYHQFFIHGDLVITSELTWGVTQSHMVGEEHSTIQISNAYMGGFLILSPLNPLAEFELLEDLESNQINLVNGRFDSKGHKLFVNEIRVGNIQQEGAAFFNFNDSEVRSSRFIVFNFGEIDAGTSDITIYDGIGNSTNLFFGGGNNFHHVTFEGEIDRIKDNNRFVQFTALAASNLALEHGEIQTAEQFVFKGTSSSPISLSSRKEGEAAILEQKEGQINGNYLILKDNSATGGADFNAFNSIDNGNVSGWDIEVTAPEDYYWVGSSGAWSDLGHWARSSGGEDLHIELPSAIDDVYFDANSTSEADTKIEVDLESILVNNLSSIGLMEGTEILVSSGKFNIYGDVHFGANLKLFFKEVEFASDSIQNLISNGSSWGFGSDLKFRNSGTIELGDELHADEISISSGFFNANGHSITTINRFMLSTLNDPVINFDNSEITTKSWIPSGPKVNLSLNNTKISSSFIFYGQGFNYDEVAFTGRNWVYGPFFTDSLEFHPGSEILILPGDTIKFNELSATGTQTDTITIASREVGELGFLYSEHGEVKGSFLKIRDNHALGGATFIAENSDVDAESVSGWTTLVSSVENRLEFQAKCFPNPAQDYFSISMKDSERMGEISIVDIYGRLVTSPVMSANAQNLMVDTSVWNEGIYFVFSHKDGWSQKVVISRN